MEPGAVAARLPAAGRGTPRGQSLPALSQARQERRAVWIFAAPPLLLYAVFVIWPIVYLVWLSLNEWAGLGPMTFVGLQNYARVLAEDLLWTAVQHNVFWAVATVAGTTTVGLALALLLARSPAWGRGLFQIIYFIPQMISSVVVAIMWRWIYYPTSGPLNVALKLVGLGALNRGWLGEADTALPALFVAYAWVAYGFAMLTFLTAIDSVDSALLESARMDGANWFQEIWHVLLPVIRPAARTVFIIMGIWSFQVFNLVWLTTRGGPGYSSVVLALLIYRNAFVESRVGISAAMAVLLSLIVLALGMIALRRGEAGEA
jgi:raffinose/stachyose/melibiose transport system permease protein